jgi:heptosyltransferase I
LLICPDTGPSHMAAALNKPVVALHAVTRPEVSGPYGQLHHAVNRYEDAVKRYGFTRNLAENARWFQKVHHPEVMHLISVEDVLIKVKKVFNY